MRIIFSKSLVTYASKYVLDNNYNPRPALAEFNDYLYRLADTVWPHALSLTEKDYPPYDKY